MVPPAAGRATVAMVVALTLASGCYEPCTLASCTSQLRIDVVANDDAELPPGTYDLLIGFDGRKPFTCSVELPASSSNIHSGDCVVVRNVTPIGEQGAGIRLATDQTPDIVTISVSHEGSLLAEETAPASYAEHSPNGESCGPTCRNGSVRVIVPTGPAT